MIVRSVPILLGLAIGVSACAGSVQPSVAQFGTATVTAQAAESTFLDALNQKKIDEYSIRLLATKSIAYDKSMHLYEWPNLPTDPSFPTRVPQSSVDAINHILKSLQAYGQAMQALSGDTAATTLATNVSSLAAQSQAVDTNVLMPLGVEGFPKSSQLSAIAAAVNDLGRLVINALISRDVQTAAKAAQQPIEEIVTTLRQINGIWSMSPNDRSVVTMDNVAIIWNGQAGAAPSLTDKIYLEGVLEKAATPVTSADADKALDALVLANAKIASAGPADANAAVQNFTQLANDAYRAYNAFLTK